MRKFGLIGYPLSHSFSKKYFEEKFKREKLSGFSYDLFPIASIEEFPALIQNDDGLEGLNVTIPYKESVLAYLGQTDEAASQIGAVNCIHIRNHQLKGYNTDVIGFETSLRGLLKHPPEIAFVLGTGGSAKAVRFVLRKMAIPFLNVSRNPGDHLIGYEQIATGMKGSNLFVNCTPLGMYPQTASAPQIPYDQLNSADYLFDLVYNPAETLFLQKGKTAGAATKNGLEMLEIQAEESWKIWNA